MPIQTHPLALWCSHDLCAKALTLMNTAPQTRPYTTIMTRKFGKTLAVCPSGITMCCHFHDSMSIFWTLLMGHTLSAERSETTKIWRLEDSKCCLYMSSLWRNSWPIMHDSSVDIMVAIFLRIMCSPCMQQLSFSSKLSTKLWHLRV